MSEPTFKVSWTATTVEHFTAELTAEQLARMDDEPDSVLAEVQGAPDWDTYTRHDITIGVTP